MNVHVVSAVQRPRIDASRENSGIASLGGVKRCRSGELADTATRQFLQLVSASDSTRDAWW